MKRGRPSKIDDHTELKLKSYISTLTENRSIVIAAATGFIIAKDRSLLNAKEMNEGHSVESVKIDLRLSTLKPIHARWMMRAFEKLRANRDVKLIGWKRTGIETAIESAIACVD